MDITEQILRLNYAGLPIEWINYQTAVRLYCSDQVTYECGDSSLIVRGGVSRITGQQSKIEINSIIATKNYSKASYKDYTPPLTKIVSFDIYWSLLISLSYKTIFGHVRQQKIHLISSDSAPSQDKVFDT